MSDPLVVPAVVTGLVKAGAIKGAMALARGAWNGFWQRVHEERDARVFEALVTEWATVSRSDPTEAAEEIEKLLTDGDPKADEALYEMFRYFALTRSPAAWPYIARVTAQYVTEGRAIDPFFRRTGWLLERFEDQDVELIRKVLTTSRGAVSNHGVDGHGTPYDQVQWVSHQVHGVAVYRSTHRHPNSAGERRAQAAGEHITFVNLIGQSRLARPLRDGDVAFLDQDGVLNRLMDLFLIDVPVGPKQTPEVNPADLGR